MFCVGVCVCVCVCVCIGGGGCLCTSDRCGKMGILNVHMNF